jgi:hypothetical protein
MQMPMMLGREARDPTMRGWTVGPQKHKNRAASRWLAGWARLAHFCIIYAEYIDLRKP